MKTPPDTGEVADTLLANLRRAGAAGANAAGLRLGGKTPVAATRRTALAALMAEGGAGMLGTGKTARYFLAAHLPTAATVAARLLAAGAFVPGALSTPPTLWKATELRRKLPKHEHALFDAALDHLQTARQVVPLRHGRSVYVAFAGPLRVWLEDDDVVDAPAPPPAPPSSDVDDAELFFAYARLVRDSGGFPDVKIAALQRAAGDRPLGDQLAALWREGRATLSLGDWSLADEATRAAAVELDGERYLFVRLES